MKGGGSASVQHNNTHTKTVTETPPGGKTVKQPTAEQLRYAQLLSSGDDSNKFQESIKQVADVTGKTHEIVAVALHDCNFDSEAAILSLLEGNYDDQENEWTTASSRKKKHQGTMQQGLDTITASPVIPTDSTKAPTTSSKPPGRGQSNRNQNKGRQQNDGGYQVENNTNSQNGSMTTEPGGKGRGFRGEDRWQPRNDRGPGGRGRGRPRRGVSGRGRSERFGGSRNRDNSGNRPGGNFSNKNTDSFNGTMQVNDFTGSELWDKAESLQPTSGGWGETLPSSEDWGSDDIDVDPNPTPVSGQENSLLENNRVPPTSNSWSDTVDAWEPSVPQKNEPSPFSETEHVQYSLESLDKAVIHSKLAKPPYSKADQPDAASSQLPSMPHIPMPTSITEKVNGQHSKLLLSEITGMSNSHSQPQPQRQQKGAKAKRPPRSQIPVQAVEMPGQSSVDTLDVQFGNLEFGGDPLSSPRFTEEQKTSKAPATSDPTPISSQPVKPVEPVVPVSTPISLSTTSAVTSHEPQTTSLNYQSHSLNRDLSQSKIPEPIPLPNQIDSRDSKPGSITIHKSVDNNKERSGSTTAPLPSSSSMPPSLGQPVRTQHSSLPPPLINKSVTHPSFSTQPNQHSIPTQLKAAQTHHTSSLSTHPTPHIGLSSHLSAQSVSLGAQLGQQSSLPPQLQQQSMHMSSLTNLSSHLNMQLNSSATSNPSLDQRVHQPAHGVGTDHHSTQNHSTSVTKPNLPATGNIPAPPPGVNINMTSSFNSGNSLPGSVTTSSSTRPPVPTNKPNFPQGVVPVFNMTGMIPYPATLPPYGFDENMQMLPRMPLQSHYYDIPQFQTTGRDGLPTNYPGGDTKFGRTDASSPVPSTISQGGHQQAFMNTLPQFGYGNLAFYAGGVMPSGFPAYTGAPLYPQMPVTTHGGGSKYQHNYVAQQPGSQGYNTSAYEDLATSQEFSKSQYHSHSSTNQQSKNSAGSLNSGSTGTTDMTGTNTFKTQYDNKNFLAGTPPPAMNLTSQVGPLNNYHHPPTAMHFVAQQHPSLYHHPHQPHHLHQHMDTSQPSSVRSQTSGSQKSGLSKGHQNAAPPYQQTTFWSGNP